MTSFVFQAVQTAANISPNRTLFSLISPEGLQSKNPKKQVLRISAAQFAVELARLAHAIESTTSPGGHVILIGGTSYEWLLSDLAIILAGRVSVPVYPSSSAGQIKHIVETTSPELAISLEDSLTSTLQEAAPHLKVWSKKDALQEANAAEVLAPLDREFLPGSTASIVFTSGTTGLPKGVILTHENFNETLKSTLIQEGEVLHSKARTVAFLPFAHILARVLAYASIISGTELSFCANPKYMTLYASFFHPTLLVAVPRVLEKVVSAASSAAASPAKARIFKKAYQQATTNPRRSFSAARVLYDRLVYSRLKERLGGKLEAIVSGGAPLDPELASFFSGAGIPIIEGYGLTESTGPAFASTLSVHSEGTVGRALPGVEYTLLEDGEILLSGPTISPGYYGHPLRDGFYHTGDLGAISPGGVLKLVGRKKDIIVTAGGKNVSPGPLEELLRGNALISQAVVFGDNRPYISVLLDLDLDEVLRISDVDGEIERILREVNSSVSKTESIKKFAVIDPLSEEDGTLTPTMKVKRAEVLRRYEDVINSLYRK